MLTDTEALDNIADYLNHPGQWNGGDVCVIVAEMIEATGRAITNDG
jgi:hypothetical protein